jgi:hypothetical protein
MYSTLVEMVAIQEIVKQGRQREEVDHAHCGYPKLTSAVTATFYVRVYMKDNSSYEVPVVTRVDYTHPVAVQRSVGKWLNA